MSWGEAIRALGLLSNDPTTHFATAINGWDYPIDRTTLAVLDLFDLTVRINADPKKGTPKPHDGRPFKFNDREVTQRGDTAGRSREEVVAILARMRNGETI